MRLHEFARSPPSDYHGVEISVCDAYALRIGSSVSRCCEYRDVYQVSVARVSCSVAVRLVRIGI